MATSPVTFASTHFSHFGDSIPELDKVFDPLELDKVFDPLAGDLIEKPHVGATTTEKPGVQCLTELELDPNV